MQKLVVSLFLIFMSIPSFAKEPFCKSWPANISYSVMKNHRLINWENVNHEKTIVAKLASEKLKEGIYKQVYLVTFFDFSGKEFEAIAIHEASSEECSWSGVDVYVLSNKLLDDNGPFLKKNK